MKIFSEFKAFAMRGNVLDLAIGIIIGAAFGSIVTSLVNDIIMPILGIFIGGVNFSDLKLVLKEAVGDKPAVTLNYGNFIQVVFDFIIVAFAIFMVIKAINAARRKQEEQSVTEELLSEEVVLLREIRDLLKK